MISIKNLTKEFSGQKVLDGIDIDIEKGEVVAIVGASGAGKSTILRCLNYLEQPDSGTIAIDDFKVDFGTITKEQILTLRRKLAMVSNSLTSLNVVQPWIMLRKVLRLLRNFLTKKLPRLRKKSSLRLGFLIVKIITHVTCQVVKSNVWPWPVPLQ